VDSAAPTFEGRRGWADLGTSSHDLWALEWRKDIWVNYGDGEARQQGRDVAEMQSGIGHVLRDTGRQGA
jgi:hypothetical protein